MSEQPTSQPTTTTKSLPAITVQPQDVLSGRGNNALFHPGNVHLRELVKTHKQQYDAAEKGAKRAIAVSIVNNVRADGRRFLKKVDGQNDMWEDIGDAATDKVSAMFRSLNSNKIDTSTSATLSVSNASVSTTTTHATNNHNICAQTTKAGDKVQFQLPNPEAGAGKTSQTPSSTGFSLPQPISATPAVKTSLPKQLQAPMSGNNHSTLPTVLDKQLQATTADNINSGSLSIDKEAATSGSTSTAESARTTNNAGSIDDKLSQITVSPAELMKEAHKAQLVHDYKTVDESKKTIVDAIITIHEEESNKYNMSELQVKEEKVENEIEKLKAWQSQSQVMGLATEDSMALSDSKIKEKVDDLAIIQGQIQDQTKIKQELKDKCFKKFNEGMNRLDDYLAKRKEVWLSFSGRYGVSEDDVRVNRDTSWQTRWDNYWMAYE